MIRKSVQRVPAGAKAWEGLSVWFDASAGEGRSEKHALGLDPRDHAQTRI